MKFTTLVAIVPDKNEEKAIEVAKQAGAGSVTILNGKNIGLEEKKVFFGLTLEENVTILLFILPIKLSMRVMKVLRSEFNMDDHKESNAIAFTMSINHIVGIDKEELHSFEKNIKNII